MRDSFLSLGFKMRVKDQSSAESICVVPHIPHALRPCRLKKNKKTSPNAFKHRSGVLILEKTRIVKLFYLITPAIKKSFRPKRMGEPVEDSGSPAKPVYSNVITAFFLYSIPRLIRDRNDSS